MAELNIGQDFNCHPIGRYYTDGTGSGEEFREEFLKKAISEAGENETITIILDDGVEGYGSSFLVEAFAGLVRQGFMDGQTLKARLEFKYSDPDFSFYEDKIKQYIDSAKFNVVHYDGKV